MSPEDQARERIEADEVGVDRWDLIEEVLKADESNADEM